MKLHEKNKANWIKIGYNWIGYRVNVPVVSQVFYILFFDKLID
jgi:hypothetical protein